MPTERGSLGGKRAAGGHRSSGQGDRKSGGRHVCAGEKGCMGIEKGRSRRFRASMCVRVHSRLSPPSSPLPNLTAPSTHVCSYACARWRAIESGSESGARTGANWSRLVCPISLPHLRRTSCVSSPRPPTLTLDRSIMLPFSLGPPVSFARRRALSPARSTSISLSASISATS